MSTVWTLEVARADGRVACVVPFRADWSAAAAWVRFEGIRRGLLPPVLLDGDAAIEPVWDAECGAPYVAAALAAREAAVLARDPEIATTFLALREDQPARDVAPRSVNHSARASGPEGEQR